MTRAGTPATIAKSGTSLLTTAPAPTSAPSPIVTPQMMVALEPIDAARFTRVASTFQSASVCRLPSAVGRARISIVREHDAVADEDLVFDDHALANERVRRDLAAGADQRFLLNLDERADLGFVADRATVEIDERRLRNTDIRAERNVVGNGHRVRSEAMTNASVSTMIVESCDRALSPETRPSRRLFDMRSLCDTAEEISLACARMRRRIHNGPLP